MGILDEAWRCGQLTCYEGKIDHDDCVNHDEENLIGYVSERDQADGMYSGSYRILM